MKTLIASLGGSRQKNDRHTGEFNYPATKYKFNDCSELFETPFIFEAILNHNKSLKNDVDQLILVGTVKSCWQDIYGYCINNKNDISETEFDYYEKIEHKSAILNSRSSIDAIENFQNFLQPLEKELEHFLSDNNDVSVHILITQYGTTESEAFYNYSKLCSIENYMPVEQKHDILLDITHSFRSMPIYNFLIINYLMRISERTVNVSAVYYGMFELKIEENSEYTPVINMNYLISMMNWINGLNEMNSYGSVEGINNCLKNDIDITNWLQIFEWASNTNNYNLLDKSLYKLSNITFDSNTYNALEKDALKKISSLMKKQFTLHSDYKIAYMQLKLSEWFFEQRRYGLAIITIQECLKSYLTYIVFKNSPNKDHTIDDIVSDETKRNDAINKLQKLSINDSHAQKLYCYYKNGKKMRNTTAHALRNTNTRDKEGSILLNEINKNKQMIQDYIKYVAECMKTKCIEHAFDDIDNLNQKIANAPYDQIIFIGKKKKNWNWDNLKKKYAISSDKIHFHEPDNYVCDYQTTNEIKCECQNIKKYIETLTTGKNSLIIIGNTNLEKQVMLINILPENNISNGTHREVKLLGESGRSGNYIYVTDKNVPLSNNN